MKKLDLMLIKGFFAPFLVSFSIALFVLVMQTLWVYIDDIIGKGAGFLVIIEFLIYLSVSLIPMALPIGVLLAGVFLFGNLGENYELSSLKSAGISLFRIMRPIIIIGFLISLVSWVLSDYVIPKSNLKFLSRLYDLKRQKPTFSIAEGEFNEDFYGYVIRIEKKSSDGMHIERIQISDHSNPNSQSNILAKNGIMYVTDGGAFLIMELYQGEMIQIPERATISNSKFPFLKSTFDTLTKVFSLKEFDLERSDEELFKSNQRMKNSKQLRDDIDSLRREKGKLIVPMVDLSKVKWKSDTLKHQNNPSLPLGKDYIEQQSRLMAFQNSLQHRDSMQIKQALDKYLKADPGDRIPIYKEALDLFRRDQGSKTNYIESMRSLSVRESKFTYELLIKYSFAVICFIFVFVGAPLGAIVRKGGYGYPLLICILVFVSYILLNTFFKRLSESLAIRSGLGTMMPCIIISILGLLLLWAAMRDRNVFQDAKHWLMSIFRIS